MHVACCVHFYRVTQGPPQLVPGQNCPLQSRARHILSPTHSVLNASLPPSQWCPADSKHPSRAVPLTWEPCSRLRWDRGRPHSVLLEAYLPHLLRNHSISCHAWKPWTQELAAYVCHTQRGGRGRKEREAARSSRSSLLPSLLQC